MSELTGSNQRCTIEVCTNSRRPAFCWKWTQRSVLLLLLLLLLLLPGPTHVQYITLHTFVLLLPGPTHVKCRTLHTFVLLLIGPAHVKHRTLHTFVVLSPDPSRMEHGRARDPREHVAAAPPQLVPHGRRLPKVKVFVSWLRTKVL